MVNLTEFIGNEAQVDGARVYLTRHSQEFHLTSIRNRIDHRRSPYVESFDNYPENISAIAKLIGTDQFLWSVEESRGFTSGVRDSEKPIEWKLKVSNRRVLGYVFVRPWNDILNGESDDLGQSFSKTRPDFGYFDVLLPFPLRREEIIGCRII